MPIELSNTINDTCGWSFSSKGMKNIFCNKFYTSAVLTLIVLVLIMIIYPCKRGTPVWVLFKLGFYILMFSFGIFVIHDSLMKNYHMDEKIGGESSDFIESLGGENNVMYEKIDVRPARSEVSKNNSPDAAQEELFSMYGV
jgi:hypothetical protein